MVRLMKRVRTRWHIRSIPPTLNMIRLNYFRIWITANVFFRHSKSKNGQQSNCRKVYITELTITIYTSMESLSKIELNGILLDHVWLDGNWPEPKKLKVMNIYHLKQWIDLFKKYIHSAKTSGYEVEVIRNKKSRRFGVTPNLYEEKQTFQSNKLQHISLFKNQYKYSLNLSTFQEYC